MMASETERLAHRPAGSRTPGPTVRSWTCSLALAAAAAAIVTAVPAFAEVDPFKAIRSTLGEGGGIIENGEIVVRLIGATAIAVGAIKAAVGRFDGPAFLAILSGFIVFALGPTFILWFDSTTPQPPTSAAAPSGSTYECMLCSTLSKVESTGRAFRQISYTALASPAMSLAQAVMLLWILIFVGGMFLNPREGGQSAAPKLILQFLWFGAVGGLLGAPDWAFGNVIGLLEETSVSLGGFIFETMRGSFLVDGSANAWNSIATDQTIANGVYAYLWGHVEATLYPVLNILAWQLKDAGWTAWIGAAVLAIVIGVPLAFVLGIFAAYLFQTMFYYMAITALAPGLVVALLFKPSRGWMWAALKFLFGGALTLVFASVAMSFTGAIIYLGLQDVWSQTGGSSATMVSDALINAANQANSTVDAPNSLAKTEFSARIFSITTSAFWITALMAWVSVLLHLNAPKIASNISGSNDSATSAAMVVAAGQMAVGMAARTMMGNSSMGGGALGAAGAFVNAARGGGGSASLASHGVVGMAAERLGRMLGGGGSGEGGGGGFGSSFSSWLRRGYQNHAGRTGADVGGSSYSAGGHQRADRNGSEQPGSAQTAGERDDIMRGFDRA